MIEKEVEIRTADGVADGFLYRPDGPGPFPGALFLSDIGGIRPANRDMARRIAGEGYAVLLPNVFYRTSRPPIWEFDFRTGGERSTKRMAGLTGPLTPEAVTGDGGAYLDFLAGQGFVGKGPRGVVGYCFSGAMAMRIAAARPDEIAAAASFHGVRLFSDAPTSPHLLLPRIHARLYFGHAVEDRGMPEEAIEQLDRALAAWGGRFESRVYEGARHGWTVSDSPVHNPPQAERAFEALTALFAATLR